MRLRKLLYAVHAGKSAVAVYPCSITVSTACNSSAAIESSDSPASEAVYIAPHNPWFVVTSVMWYVLYPSRFRANLSESVPERPNPAPITKWGGVEDEVAACTTSSLTKKVMKAIKIIPTHCVDSMLELHCSTDLDRAADLHFARLRGRAYEHHDIWQESEAVVTIVIKLDSLQLH
eukprot:m.113806 g.113806  ORF g.113806 m.113806 type:complete len:176 (+) comp28295_c0_seq1:745-1272(+)